jgi:two-component system chemotaxis sensor kinase CheA
LSLATAHSHEDERKWPGILLEWAGAQTVLLVDEVLHDQEVVMKSLGRQLVRVRNVSGAAMLETGKVAPVLNVGDLMRSAGGRWSRPSAPSARASIPNGPGGSWDDAPRW